MTHNDKPAVHSAAVDLTITQEMVHDFAGLCGDVSSLHVDSAFGRRSMYRDNVVHGMLPVMGLALAIDRAMAGRTLALSKLTASFSGPVFIGDSVRIEIEQTDGDMAMNYVIRNAVSGVTLTHGAISLHPAQAPERGHISEASRNSSKSLVIDRISEANSRFDEIERGQERKLNVHCQASHAEALIGLLRGGMDDESPDEFRDLQTKPIVPQLLGAALYSTFVGVCLPGRSATFLNCTLEFPSEIHWNGPALLEGTVTFKSASTQTIIERIVLRQPEDPERLLIDGRIKTRVNAPATVMPTVRELADGFGSLGLQGKVVLITGASRGLGETMAKLFAVHGCKVVVNYFRGEEDARRIVSEIHEFGGTAIALGADVTEQSEVQTLVQSVEDEFGTVDVLINNAVRDFAATSFLDLTWDDVQKECDVVVKGAFHCCQAALPMMVARKSGKIINVGTLATDVPPPRQTKYVLAKSGLLGLTRSLAAEFASCNIQVNMVSPSMVQTDLTAGVSNIARQQIANSTPMNRLAKPGEVAAAVAFLASSFASFTTGQRIMVTGGSPPYL